MSTEAIGSNDSAILEHNSEEPAPLGSIFKLYVLLAVAQAVDAGDISWDTMLTVSEENRSLPSGELQEEPDGTQITVREAATKMIEISDNTATDMLIQVLGRDAIEDAVLDSGHHDPESMVPFLSSREMFQIGWGDPAYLEAWSTGNQEQQRELLDQLERQPIDRHDIAVGGDPVWPQGVDWFASPQDIAAVHIALQKRDDPTIREILSQNPGVDQHSWDYVGFKGGSSLGVLTGSWIVEDSAGESYVVVIQTSTEDASGIGSEAQSLFFRLAGSALELTSSERK